MQGGRPLFSWARVRHTVSGTCTTCNRTGDWVLRIRPQQTPIVSAIWPSEILQCWLLLTFYSCCAWFLLSLYWLWLWISQTPTSVWLLTQTIYTGLLKKWYVWQLLVRGETRQNRLKFRRYENKRTHSLVWFSLLLGLGQRPGAES